MPPTGQTSIPLRFGRTVLTGSTRGYDPMTVRQGVDSLSRSPGQRAQMDAAQKPTFCRRVVRNHRHGSPYGKILLGL
jgi:hypothetical protein